jgi:uncharacterized protein involved in exopolysaccharide biosynthesis
MAIPNEYRADATIILEPYRPHAELVIPAVTPLLEDRLRVARQQLLSGPILEKVVTDNDLYPKAREKGGMDAAVDMLRKHVDVRPDGDSAIILSYRTNEKEKAAPVVTGIAQGFIAANASLRESQAKRVLDTIEKQMNAVKGDLDAAQDKVHAYRTSHDGELPEQSEANLGDADRATHLLESAQGYIRALEDRRSALPSSPTSPEIEHLATIESEMVRDLAHAQATEAPDHPERVRLERVLKTIRAEKTREVARVDTIQRERAEIASELSKTRAEVTSLLQRIKDDRDRAAAAAKWLPGLGVLERDRDMLSDKYKSLMSRKVETEVSLGLEQASGPVATRVVDPPAVPIDPASPDRARLFLVVLVLALAVGAAAGVLAETRDTSLRSPTQARTHLGVPLLAVLPGFKTGPTMKSGLKAHEQA